MLSSSTAYMEYFEWRRTHTLISYFSSPDTCDVCRRLHEALETGESHTVKDMGAWLKETQFGCRNPK